MNRFYILVICTFGIYFLSSSPLFGQKKYPFSSDIEKREINASGLGQGYDVRFIDPLNLRKVTLRSGHRAQIIRLNRDHSRPVIMYRKKYVKPKGVTFIRNKKRDDVLRNQYITSASDFEKTLLSDTYLQIASDSIGNAREIEAFTTDAFVENGDAMYVYSTMNHLEYSLDLSTNVAYHQRDINSDFINDLARVGRDISAEGFLYRYGTHLATKAYYGGNLILRNTVTKKAYEHSSLSKQEFKRTIKGQIEKTLELSLTGEGQDPIYPVALIRSNDFSVPRNAANDLSLWKKQIRKRPELVRAKLQRITSFMNKKMFPSVYDLAYKRHLLDSVINRYEEEAKSQRAASAENNFFEKKPLKFRLRASKVVKLDAGKGDGSHDYVGHLLMGFFNATGDIIKTRSLFGYDETASDDLITDETVNVNKVLEVMVDPKDFKKGYISVWDDAKKLVRSRERSTLRISGPKESRIYFKEAMSQQIDKEILLKTIDNHVFKINYSLTLIDNEEPFDNSSALINDIMDSQLVTAAATGDIDLVRQLIQDGANVNARGIISAAIVSKQSVKVINCLSDYGVPITNEDLEAVFHPDYFNPAIAVALLERGAKPKNNMIFKAVAFNAPNVVYALLREGAKPVNNDLDLAIKNERYEIVKALKNSANLTRGPAEN